MLQCTSLLTCGCCDDGSILLWFVGNNNTSLFTIGTHLHWWFPKPLALSNCSKQNATTKYWHLYQSLQVTSLQWGHWVMVRYEVRYEVILFGEWREGVMWWGCWVTLWWGMRWYRLVNDERVLFSKIVQWEMRCWMIFITR